jgi:hypothetical protein
MSRASKSRQVQAEEQRYVEDKFQQNFDAEQREKDEALKKRMQQKEIADTYKRQIEEKNAKKLQSKQDDTYYAKTAELSSSFANQDKQRYEFFSKLKEGTISSEPQKVREPEQKKSDIFNQKPSQRAPVERQQSQEYDQINNNDKKNKEREIFLENQMIANAKKTVTEQRKNDEKYYDLQKAQHENSKYEQEQANSQYNKGRQQEETSKNYGDQVYQKKQSYGSEQGTKETRGTYQVEKENDESLFGKNRQRNAGANYNILTGN